MIRLINIRRRSAGGPGHVGLALITERRGYGLVHSCILK